MAQILYVIRWPMPQHAPVEIAVRLLNGNGKESTLILILGEDSDSARKRLKGV
jgi:hypothetical protein